MTNSEQPKETEYQTSVQHRETGQHQAASGRIDTAENAANDLRDALAAHGITLPSLRVDPVTCARDEPNPLIELGCCNVETVRHLTAALRAAG